MQFSNNLCNLIYPLASKLLVKSSGCQKTNSFVTLWICSPIFKFDAPKNREVDQKYKLEMQQFLASNIY